MHKRTSDFKACGTKRFGVFDHHRFRAKPPSVGQPNRGRCADHDHGKGASATKSSHAGSAK
jgi:hypothetical protein